MIKVEQLLSHNGESVFPVIDESQIKHKANILDVGNLNELETEVKSNLVLAINENTKNIAKNLQQLGLRVTKNEVEQMISFAVRDIIREGELNDAMLASAVIISINDTLVELKNLKADKKDIPTKISELVNDSGFITKVQLAEVDLIQKIQSDIIDIYEDMGGMASKEDLSALETALPTKVSDLENDSHFIQAESEGYLNIQKNINTLMAQMTSVATKGDLSKVADSIPTKVSQLQNDSGFITMEDVPAGNIQQAEADIEVLKLTKAEQSFVEKEVQRLDDLINAIEIPEGTDVRPIMKSIEELKEKKADRGEIPKKVSQLENDLKFVTESELGSHQQIIEILDSIKAVGDSTKKTEEILIQVESDVTKQKQEILQLEQSTTRLQSDVGALDIDVNSQKTKVDNLEKNQRDSELKVAQNKKDIQLNKDSITSIKEDVSKIPKKTSDIINDSGFINKDDIISIDLSENQTIKSINTVKANKSDIPTNVGQLQGVGDLQTKEDASQEHQEIKDIISLKADRSEIPTKISEIEDDIKIATQSDVDTLNGKINLNKKDIQTIQETKRVFVSSQKIPVESREEGSLYLQIGDTISILEDHLGSQKYLETSKIMQLDKHPVSPMDGTTYVLKTSQKMYVTLGGVPKPLATLEDVDQKHKDVMNVVTSIQEDMASISDRVDTNVGGIAEANENLQGAKLRIGKIESNMEKYDMVLDGQGRDIVDLREKDNTHDSQILILDTKKANKSDIPLSTSQLTNDSGFITMLDLPPNRYTQTDEPSNMNIGDEWHKIID